MPVQARCSARLGQVVLAGASLVALVGCGSLDGASQRIASAVTPYKIDVVQGNFVSSEQVRALQPGMSRQQVRDILGTPLVTSLFHADRWEYVFTIKRPGQDRMTRALVVFFKGDVLERSEGDEMPSETEFVATFDAGTKGKVPVLQATPEQLAKYPAAPRPTVTPGDVACGLARANSYPPLESSAQ